MEKIIRGVEESIKYLSEQKIDQQIKEANIKNFEFGAFDALEIKDEGTEGEEILFRRLPIVDETENIMEYVESIFRDQVSNEVSIEIITSAFIYLKANPDKSIIESIKYGYGQWIK